MMITDNIHLSLSQFFDFLDSPEWRAWPFNSGYGEHMLPAIARMAFVALIFAVILLFLRVLYGPKGIFRDKEMDREAEHERQMERTALKSQYENNEISELEYKTKMRSLQD